jgi:hypothetical protein
LSAVLYFPLSAVCLLFTCRFNPLLYLYAFPQFEHLNLFSSLCFTSWSFKYFSYLNSALHPQVYLFSTHSIFYYYSFHLLLSRKSVCLPLATIFSFTFISAVAWARFFSSKLQTASISIVSVFCTALM